jgi:hypothetical protein
MKSFRIIFTLILTCAIGAFSYAQKDNTEDYRFPDTLNVMVDENIRLMIVSENLCNLQPGDTIDKLITKFNDDILKVEYPYNKDKFIKIFYRIGKNGASTIKFEDITEDNRDYQVFENGATLEPMPIQLILTIGKNTRAIFYLPGPAYFEELSSYLFQDILPTVLETSKEELHNMCRQPVMINWWMKDGKPDPELKEMYVNADNSIDMITLSGTVGASLIRNRLVPSIDFNLGVIIGKKTYQSYMVRAEASMIYTFNQDTEGKYTTDINTFLGVSYYINSSKNPDKPRWFGVGLSYLAWRNGNFFGENTFRFTVGARFGKHFSVMPELYISDGFKKAMPGLKIQVTF